MIQIQKICVNLIVRRDEAYLVSKQRTEQYYRKPVLFAYLGNWYNRVSQQCLAGEILNVSIESAVIELKTP